MRAENSERLGTGHGEREYAPITQITFDRASDRPVEVVRVRYDSHDRLVALGVIPAWPLAPPTPIAPEPFARSFVPDPR